MCQTPPAGTVLAVIAWARVRPLYLDSGVGSRSRRAGGVAGGLATNSRASGLIDQQAAAPAEAASELQHVSHDTN